MHSNDFFQDLENAWPQTENQFYLKRHTIPNSSQNYSECKPFIIDMSHDIFPIKNNKVHSWKFHFRTFIVTHLNKLLLFINELPLNEIEVIEDESRST